VCTNKTLTKYKYQLLPSIADWHKMHRALLWMYKIKMFQANYTLQFFIICLY